MAAVENLDAVIDLEVALLDAGLDAGDVEDGDPVHRLAVISASVTPSSEL